MRYSHPSQPRPTRKVGKAPVTRTEALVPTSVPIGRLMAHLLAAGVPAHDAERAVQVRRSREAFSASQVRDAARQRVGTHLG